jgi:pSer/pThr/pTyr-binding forkhead associated (FHA) protein
VDSSEIKDAFELLGEGAFAARYGRYFLVLTATEELDSFSSYVNTATRAAHEITASRGLDNVDIRPLQSNDGGPRVTIGREKADVTIGERSVSKLHAAFSLEGGLLSLADLGSKNGTWLNGTALLPNHPSPVDVGDTVSFGTVTGTVWGLDDLTAAIQSDG